MKEFAKKNAVLCTAWIMAAASAFAVPPGLKYLDYIDWKTLGTLWTLMIIMQYFSYRGVFGAIGRKLLEKTSNAGQLSAVLVLLCFFMSMLITNDVALITFVPFAVMLLESCGRRDLMITVIVLQTVAANLGSMMLQVGNPQNLYLYGISSMTVMEFISLMAPYSALSLVLLIICLLFIKGRRTPVNADITMNSGIEDPRAGDKVWTEVFALIFILALSSVARLIPWYVPAVLVLAASLVFRKDLLLRADYELLLTFTGFFIFTGNIAGIPAVSSFLSSAVKGHEIIVSAAVSQIISNVPAALLLSGFTDDVSSLIVGTDLGGLGTLIASMASLISFKYYSNVPGARPGRYIAVFTAVNIVFLGVLSMLCTIIS